MGTRSLTVFKEENEGEIVVLYRQFDGYPDGHGKDLAEFLSGGKMVNGLTYKESGKVFNGMGCLTAQVVAHFKTEPGSFYLYPAGTRDCWEDYTYIVSGKVNHAPTIEVWENHYQAPMEKLFEGTPDELLAWLEKSED